MTDIAIRVENLSKLYHIGRAQQRHDTLRDVLSSVFSRQSAGRSSQSSGRSSQSSVFSRQSHPGTDNSQLKTDNSQLKTDNSQLKTDDSLLWALRDVSFEVKRGEVVGIIGRNGAGKSTLLKILSRITEPTSGRAEIHGRVASLLEVGTGFHPELTGRENIYLNGAILGMKRTEIERRFDEIVAFAEIERFLDTPVKRYSSGMYVRLAFGVAAHLEPEILLVDEVLAVGDAAFQKKCLGKMGDVAKGGRTVLFVSHNVNMIRSLCKRSMLVTKGRISQDGDTHQVVMAYASSWATGDNLAGEVSWLDPGEAPACDELRLHSIRLLDSSGHVCNVFDIDKPIVVEIIHEQFTRLRGMRILVSFATEEGVTAFVSTDQDQRANIVEPGLYKSRMLVPGQLLNCSRYFVRLAFDIPGIRVLVGWEDYLLFEGKRVEVNGTYIPPRWEGVFAPRLQWSQEQL